MTSQSGLTSDIAAHFAAIALRHIQREYPAKLDHVIRGPDELRSPAALHPVFYGSFDWHSCVHGYWVLATIYRRFPRLSGAAAIARLFDEQLVSNKIDAEVAYLRERGRESFERPYGWAWALMLCAELARHETPAGNRWSAAVAPLGSACADRFLDFLPKATYPIRAGTHFNTAFAIALALDYARVVHDDTLAVALRDSALHWYSHDVGCQAWEPSGDDFLSPALIEAECMRRVLEPRGFSEWLARFLPRLSIREPRTLFHPVTVSDRSDAKIVHLDGVNLSRAWCWRSLAGTWPESDSRRIIALEAASEHLAAGLPHVTGHYMGEHWLATFAVLALTAGSPSPEGTSQHSTSSPIQ